MSAGLRRRSVLGGSGHGAGRRTGPMMTPMVDVVLVILIFFMAATTIAGQEWFLQAGVEVESAGDSALEEARFDLPAAVIEVDLVSGEDGAVFVYGVSGDQGMTIDQAVGLIEGMELAESDALRVGLGAGDGVLMGDVMRVHDAWHGRGVKVVMRTGR